MARPQESNPASLVTKADALPLQYPGRLKFPIIFQLHTSKKEEGLEMKEGLEMTERVTGRVDPYATRC